ncbi:hypothetical protein BU16DRAFT_386108 [Lophium mytilinum]|uniref:Uncharacterized protein n=1 Tax=Lophium mytilinum TaxID=390894 RepID=A0A6A6QSA9_9PEZI|nr:hypothetical protein BU16DRAFT_386108 [Lophium mytilinum]
MSCYYGNNGQEYCQSSAWDNWVRWVVLAVVVIGFFLLFILCSCLTARRRRRAGRQPFYGTGWAGGRVPPGHNPATYNAQPYYSNNNNQPAPPYTAAQTENYYGNGANQGYYGQQNGVELQSPQPAHTPYRGEDSVYTPPAGPPPNKQHDGIIR